MTVDELLEEVRRKHAIVSDDTDEALYPLLLDLWHRGLLTRTRQPLSRRYQFRLSDAGRKRLEG